MICSYNLGNGPVILRSTEQLELGVYHRIVAQRYEKNGTLIIDGKYNVSGESQGALKYLDLYEHMFLGSVPEATQRYVSYVFEIYCRINV